jgi:hypothetical protein
MLTNVFQSEIFKFTTLTDAINHLPYRPMRLQQIGLFEERGIPTTTVVVEKKDGVLDLLPTKMRGEPATPGNANRRTALSFVVPHIPHETAILAADIQDVRRFGSDSELEAVAQVVNDRMQEMRQNHEVTHEYHRIGAVKGIILDADGTTELFDLFDRFDITQTDVDFLLGTGSTNIRDKCLEVKRAIEDALGMAMYDHVHCLCDKTWFGKFINHENVKAAYERWQSGEALRNDPRAGFEFAGIVFEEYRGSVNGVPFIADDECHFFPVGTPGLFKRYNAPANMMETANTIGLPVYAKSEAKKFNTGVDIYTESNPLHLCTKPAALIKGYSSN